MPKKRSRAALLIFLFLLVYFFAVLFWLGGGAIFGNIIQMTPKEQALVVLGALAVALFAVMIEKRVRF